MAEVRNWFNNSSTNLFAPAPVQDTSADTTNFTNLFSQPLASPNFSSSGNAWDMPNYTSPTSPTPTLQPMTAPTSTDRARGGNDIPFTGATPATGGDTTATGAPTWSITPPASSSQTGGGQQPAGGVTDWFGGQSPWNPNVTAGTVNADLSPGPTTSFTQSGWNVNYPTQAAANQVGQMFGANVVPQNMSGDWGPAGAPSAPMYGLDFGIGDPQNAGQVAFWLQRGDSIPDIQARLAAGINPPLGPGQASATDWNFASPTYTTPGAPGNGTINTGAQPSTHLGPIGGPTTNLQPGAVSGGGTIQVPGATTPPPATGTPTTPTAGNAPIDWSSWRAFLNSNYFPLAEPGASPAAINQNFTSSMLQNPVLAAFLGITPQSGTPTVGGGGTGQDANSGINALFRALGLGGGQQQQMNPFLSSFLQSLLFTPQMYLR